MAGAEGVRVMLRGPFAIIDREGGDRTPTGQKERALIALLALAPGHKRSRIWLTDKLWSDRTPEQAATSLRRALSNLRATFAPDSKVLQADRINVWLGDHVVADLRPDLVPHSEMLEDLNVRDPEFEDWLRDLRQQHDGAPPEPVADSPEPARRRRSGPTEIVIHRTAAPKDPDERFLASLLCDSLSSRFLALGDATVRVVDGDARAAPEPGGAAIRIEIESVTSGGDWLVHLRAVANENRQFLWSGRLTVPLNLARITGGTEIAGFVSRATSGIVGRFDTHCAGERDAFLSVQRASQRLFTGQPSEIRRAQQDLSELPLDDRSGLVLAWRGYAKLTEALEFGLSDLDTVGEATSFVDDAVKRSAENPLVLALAAQVQMKLGADRDFGTFLARRSFEKDDQDPYALHALSQARLFAGNPAKSHDMARWAREAADGLPNAHCWDFQLALSKLAFGDLQGALRLCSAAHVKSGSYRPAMRYLVALNLILGDTDAALRHARSLARFEPGFVPAHLLRPSYPIETLKLAGLAEDLADALRASAEPPILRH